VLRLNKRYLFIILFVSGFYFLYSEILWQRILKLLLGSSVLSSSLVLTAIMSGLALGYLLSIRLIERISQDRLLKISFLLSIISSFLSVLILRYVDFYRFISGIINIEETSGFSIVLFNYLFALLVTIIPCISAGMIIPAVQSFMPIKEFSATYMAYNAGGLAGGFICAFYSIRYLGLYTGFYIISALLLALGIYLQFLKPWGRESIEKEDNQPCKDFGLSSRWITGLLIMLGFSSLSLQVLFSRVLSVIVSNTTYSFSTVVLVYIAGISAGSYLSGRTRAKGMKSLVSWLLILAFYVVSMSLLLEKIGGIYVTLGRALAQSYFRTLIPVFVLCVILLFIPSICINILFIRLTRALGGQKREKTASSRSLLYSTAGSVAGALLTTFFLLPYIGISKSLILLALVFTAVNIFLAPGKKAKALVSALVIIILLLFFFFSAKVLPPSVFRLEHRDDKLVFYEETPHGNVCVIEDQSNNLLAAYVDNNAVIGTAYDAMKTVNMLGFMPLLYNPAPARVLVIGFGMGVTSGVLGTAAGDDIYSVEIVPAIFRAAEFFRRHNYSILENKRLNRVAMDGRIFLNYTKNSFDIISCDPTHPLLGSNALYTAEYFQLCKSRLKENGIMTQYLPMHFLSHRSFLSILKNFASAFDDLTIWLSYTHLVIMGRKGNISMDFRNIRDIDIDVRKNMQAFGITDLSSVLSNYICSRDTLVKNLPEDMPHNSDSFPFVEFDTFFDREEEFKKNIEFITGLRSVPTHLIGDAGEEKVKMAHKAREYMIKALVLEREGRIKEAVEQLEMGLNVYRGDAEMRNYLSFLKRQANQ